MGTYDTRGGGAISPPAEGGPCDVCGGDPYDCGCPECPECGASGDPRCAVSRERALAHARSLTSAHRDGDFMQSGDDDWLVRKAAELERIAGSGCGSARHSALSTDALREALEACREINVTMQKSANADHASIKRLEGAARHALTFIENRFSDLSPEKWATVEHLRAALSMKGLEAS